MSTKGYKQTDEHKLKLRISNLGKKRSEETRRNISIGKTGTKYSEEHKKNIGIAQIGRVHSKESVIKGAIARTGKKRSEEFCKKMSLARIGKPSPLKGIKMGVSPKKGKRFPELCGENSPSWKGGLTPILQLLRNCDKYKAWRNDVFVRDNYACIQCGDNKGGNLEADHIIPFSTIFHGHNIKGFYHGLDCLDLWKVENGRTLCKECHKKTETFGSKAKSFVFTPSLIKS